MMAAANSSTKRSKKRRPYKVSGKFKCPDCPKQWNSSWTWIRKSLRGNEYSVYGQKCNKCRGDFIHPHDWDPLPWCSKCDNEGSKCYCKNEINKHRRDVCGRCHSDDPCPNVPTEDKPKPQRWPRNKEERKPYRVFGWFECTRCGNEWMSAYAWVRLSLRGNETPAFKQECRMGNCSGQIAVYPYKWAKLKCPICDQPVDECECDSDASGPEDDGLERPHKDELCEKCQLGYPCREKRRSKKY